MTIRKRESNSNSRFLSSVTILSFAVVASVFLSPMVNEFTKSGLSLCFSVVVGSVFPFMILTDIIATKTHFENISPFRKLFEKLFNINGAAISAFIAGAVCGFPLGVKVATDLYKNGVITNEECERLIGFSNNTGPAFAISGIGVALLGSYTAGIVIYISMIISAIAVGFIFGIRQTPSCNTRTQQEVRFDFITSLKKATLNTLNICGFVVIFSVIFGLFTLIVKNSIALTLISPFIEVSNGAKTIAASSLSTELRIALSSFAVSFSGLSVHLQAKCFTSDSDISMKKYYKMKLLQGFLSFIITTLIIEVVNI